MVTRKQTCCPSKKRASKFNFEKRTTCYERRTPKGRPAAAAPQPHGAWKEKLPPSVRASPMPKGSPPLADQQINAFAGMDSAAQKA
eukprot:2681504-Pyramimonas_sp.AAC.1